MKLLILLSLVLNFQVFANDSKSLTPFEKMLKDFNPERYSDKIYLDQVQILLETAKSDINQLKQDGSDAKYIYKAAMDYKSVLYNKVKRIGNEIESKDAKNIVQRIKEVLNSSFNGSSTYGDDFSNLKNSIAAESKSLGTFINAFISNVSNSAVLNMVVEALNSGNEDVASLSEKVLKELRQKHDEINEKITSLNNEVAGKKEELEQQINENDRIMKESDDKKSRLVSENEVLQAQIDKKNKMLDQKQKELDRYAEGRLDFKINERGNEIPEILIHEISAAVEDLYDLLPSSAPLHGNQMFTNETFEKLNPNVELTVDIGKITPLKAKLFGKVFGYKAEISFRAKSWKNVYEITVREFKAEFDLGKDGRLQNGDFNNALHRFMQNKIIPSLEHIYLLNEKAEIESVNNEGQAIQNDCEKLLAN